MRKRWPSTVDEDLLESVRILSARTGIAMSKLLDEALTDILDKYKNPNAIVKKLDGL